MEKIFKKSLAFIVSATLCLTAFVGCLTVNAEGEKAATLTIGNVTVASDATTADVPVTIAGSPVAGARFDVVVDTTKATLSDVTFDNNTLNVSVLRDGQTGAPRTVVADTYRIVVEATGNGSGNDLATFTNASFTLNFDIADSSETIDVTGGTVADACDLGDVQGNSYGAENAVALTVVDGSIAFGSAVVEPVLDSNIQMTRAIRIQDTVGVTYVVPAALVSAYDDFYIEISYVGFDGNYNAVEKTAILNKSDNISPSPAMIILSFPGVALYELNSTLSATLYGLDENDNVVAYSNEFNDSVVSLALALYNSTNSIPTKTVLTDLLNMGAEAQQYFSTLKPGSDLAAVELANADIPQTYASAEVATSELVTTGSTVVSKGNFGITNGISVAGSPCVSYMVTGISGYDMSKMTLRVSYTDAYAGKTVVEEVSGADIQLNAALCVYIFSKTALYDGNKVVTAEIIYNGETYLTNTCTVEKFIESKYNDAQLGSLVKEIAKFGNSARAYFGIN